MMRTGAVILAAGEGKRMHSPHSKVVHRVAQRPMIAWVAETCAQAGADDTVVVVGHRREEVQATLGTAVRYAVQEELLGTGHAVMQAMPLLEDTDTVVVLSGDAPLIRPETVRAALAFHREQGYAVTVFAAVLPNPFGYGRIIRDGAGNLLKIVEQKDATESEQSVCEVNGGMYCFDRALLKQALGEIRNDNAQHEYYLPDTIAVLRGMGHTAGVFCMEDAQELSGVNDMVQLHDADRIMRRRINSAHAAQGVYIWDLENTYIAPEVEIEAGAEILPGCILSGNTHIAAGAKIGPQTTVENCKIGAETDVTYSVVKDSVIGANTHIGPFAYIRPDCKVGDGCKVGDFVELKNATLGDGTKASHLTYVGDALVGSHVNFGCGTITVNYDGSAKHKTLIGSDVFVGCNSNLIAPVSVGDGAYIAAGSTITDEVPGETLAIARARQVIKENWKDKRKKS